MDKNSKEIEKRSEDERNHKPWFKDYLQREISKRRILNKERRKCKDEIEKSIYKKRVIY